VEFGQNDRDLLSPQKATRDHAGGARESSEIAQAKERDRRPTYSSQVLDRLMLILNCFTAKQPEIRFSDLVDKLKLHKSTVYRLLEAMRSYGLVDMNTTTGQYHLGMKLFELGALAKGRVEISKVGIPFLQDLAMQTGETAHMCILDGLDVVYINKVESKEYFYVPSTVGRRNPAYCTGVGKAILAYLPMAELEAYLAQMARNGVRSYTRNTITSPDELREHLKVVRTHGYSVDDEEISLGLRCIGAAVRDDTSEVVGGISIAGPSARITRGKIPKLARHVVAAAARMSIQLGFSSKNPRKGNAYSS
jgi:IclR family transcriptional regulator, KDG regulon repressor